MKAETTRLNGKAAEDDLNKWRDCCVDRLGGSGGEWQTVGSRRQLVDSSKKSVTGKHDQPHSHSRRETE